jgi:hypothetical protein
MVVFAAHQSGAISAQPPSALSEVAGYLAEVKKVKSRTFEQGPNHYCNKPLHGGTRGCAGTDDKHEDDERQRKAQKRVKR